jgi:hypothetical protein
MLPRMTSAVLVHTKGLGCSLRIAMNHTTMNIYTHAMDRDRIEAQGLMLEKLIQKAKSDSVQ